MQVRYGWEVNNYSFVTWDQCCTFSCSVAVWKWACHVTLVNKEISNLPTPFLVDFISHWTTHGWNGSNYSDSELRPMLLVHWTFVRVAVWMLACHMTFEEKRPVFSPYPLLVDFHILQRTTHGLKVTNYIYIRSGPILYVHWTLGGSLEVGMSYDFWKQRDKKSPHAPICSFSCRKEIRTDGN